ncbi:MAG: hypothetical protein GX442_08830 [Candidatus Riflebacteria bacterium]|nr:hypothetical protein [Candidatus Riflebacteria bacterium]
MPIRIKRLDGGLAVFMRGEPVRTPLETPIISRHRPLLEEIVRDIRLFGPDPVGTLSMLSLQASYLDFGLPTPRTDLERGLAVGLETDAFLSRPPSRVLRSQAETCFGPTTFDPAAWRQQLQGFGVRQLIGVVMSATHFGSAILGTRLLAGRLPPSLLALGICARHLRYLALRQGGSEEDVPPHAFEPPVPDTAYCDGFCCSSQDDRFALFTRRCRVFDLLGKLQRFAAYPEE